MVSAPVAGDADRSGDADFSLPAAAARMRHVRGAVAALESALGSAGGAYLAFVADWMKKAEAGGGRLPKFPDPLKKAGARLPASPPAVRAGRDAFLRAVDEARRLYPDAAPPSLPARRSQTLSSAVRGALVLV